VCVCDIDIGRISHRMGQRGTRRHAAIWPRQNTGYATVTCSGLEHYFVLRAVYYREPVAYYQAIDVSLSKAVLLMQTAWTRHGDDPS